MSFSIIQEFGSAEHVAHNLEQSGRRVNELLPIMEEIGADMIEATAKFWQSGGRRGGGSWKKLKPDTIKRKGNAQILVETGRLKASLTEPGAPYQILNASAYTVEFGTEEETGAWHHHGAGNLPVRRILQFTQFDTRRWNKKIADFLMKPFNV